MKNPHAPRLALLMTIVAAVGCSHSKSNAPASSNPQITVTIKPEAVTLAPGESVSFSVFVNGPSDTVIVWSVVEGAEGGTVSKDGVFTAPSAMGLFHVAAMATGPNYTASYATAEVTVTDGKTVILKDGGVSGAAKDGGPSVTPKDGPSVSPKDASSIVTPKDTGSTSGPHVTRDSNGWTVVTPSSDSRIIYVSSSGNDKNDGSEANPLKTIAAGIKLMRRGYPDWLLLKAGDTWNESIEAVGGRSVDEPALISSYGTGARPMLNPVGDSALTGNGTAPHLYVIGLEFYNPAKDPSSTSFKDGVTSASGVRWVAAGNDLLVEDCSLRFLSEGFNIQGADTAPLDKIQLRRNFISDMYINNAHSQGSYYKQVNNLLVEENIFDHNGWIVDPKVTPNGYNAPNVFNHDIYLEGSFNHAVIRGNIFMRSGSLAVNLVNYSSKPNFSTDTLVENNFFFEGELGVSASYGTVDGKMTSGSSSTGFTIQNNVLLQINRDNPTKRPIGIGVSIKSLADSIIKGNIFSDFSFTNNTSAIAVVGDDETYINTGITVDSNILYRIRELGLVVAPRAGWANIKVMNNEIQDPDLGSAMVSHQGPFSVVTYSGNTYFASKPENFALIAKAPDGAATQATYEQWVSQSGETGSQAKAITYPDPGRNLETYLKSLNKTGGLPDFFSAVRAQSKANWRAEYTAAVINNYIRAGFGRKAL